VRRSVNEALDTVALGVARPDDHEEGTVVLDAPMVTFMEAGSALIVGSVALDGAPHAGRGWGLDVLDVAAGRIRLLVDADDDRSRANLVAGRPVAVTCTDVISLSSMQFKGTSAGLVPSASTDPARVRRYTDAFYRDIQEADRTPRALLERLTPDQVVAFELDIEVVFDQTPGPGAGREVGAGPDAPTGSASSPGGAR
jgi:hypothetical protein